MASFGTPVPSIRYTGKNPTHPTSNLPGYPAVDIMAPVGTPAVAAEDGYVYRLGSAQGGVSLYLKGISGADHWYGHLGGYTGPVRSVTSGRPLRVRKGQPLGWIGPHPNGSHLHYGVSGANAAAIASTPQEVGSIGGSTGTGKPGRKSSTFWPVPDIPYVPQFPQDVPGFDKIGPALGVGVPSITNPLKAFNSISDFLEWISGNWDRIAEVFSGFILVLVGLILLGRSVGLSGMRGGKLDAVDPLERAYAQGEESWLRSEARRAGRKAAAARDRGVQGGEIPY